MSVPRTFKIERPLMQGDDIREWQVFLDQQFAKWQIDYPIVVDGVYGVGTRSATASYLHALGMQAGERMAKGVTPWLRSKVRARRLSAAERARFAARVGYRRRLRAKYRRAQRVAPPLNRILASSWGYHPGVHDGVDLICDEDAPGFAICTGRIVRADGGGWWGKGAPSDPNVRGRGDGVVVLECTVSDGPFRPGLRFVYGHAEKPRVKVGDYVRAGEHICNAGMANAWHFHFCVNRRTDAKGVGDHDPMPYVRHALRRA